MRCGIINKYGQRQEAVIIPCISFELQNTLCYARPVLKTSIHLAA